MRSTPKVRSSRAREMESSSVHPPESQSHTERRTKRGMESGIEFLTPFTTSLRNKVRFEITAVLVGSMIADR